MAKHVVRPGQNIFDVSIELYGSIEGIFDLLISNSWLNMNTNLKTGMVLEYHDYFVINDGIVSEIKNQKYIPSNSERRMYLKRSEYEIMFFYNVNETKTNTEFVVSGNGRMDIDWGDDSVLESIQLSTQPVVLSHYFDNNVDVKKVKVYGDFSLITFDSSKINGDLVLVRPMIVDEYISKSNGTSLKGLLLFEGTVIVDLRGMTIVDLLPIGDMNLQELNLLGVDFINTSVLDEYLQYIVDNYENRRNCTVYLGTEPTEVGMQAIQTIINEPSWNESGKWKFIINDIVYTKE